MEMEDIRTYSTLECLQTACHNKIIMLSLCYNVPVSILSFTIITLTSISHICIITVDPCKMEGEIYHRVTFYRSFLYQLEYSSLCLVPLGLPIKERVEQVTAVNSYV